MDYKEAASLLASEAIGAGLRVECEFVPLSRSRNAREKHPTVNWRVRLFRADRLVWEGDYSQGVAHLTNYPGAARVKSVDGAKAIENACESGRGSFNGLDDVRAVPPTLSDVLHALLLDGGAIDAGSFEDWAASFGYDTDSRKAEAIYQECVQTGLKLRRAIGDSMLRRFQELAGEM